MSFKKRIILTVLFSSLFFSTVPTFALHQYSSIIENYNSEKEYETINEQTLSDNDQTKINLLLNKGISLFKQNQLDEALSHFDEVLEMDINNKIALKFISYIYEEKNNYGAAFAFLYRINELYEKDPDVLSSLAYYIINIKNFRDLGLASHYVDGAINLDETNPQSLTVKGMILNEKGSLDEASKYFDTALSLSPQFILAKIGIAENLYLKQNYKDSSELYKQLFSIDPSDNFIILGTAKSSIEFEMSKMSTTGSIDPEIFENIKLLEDLIDTNKNFEEAYYFLGITYYNIAKNQINGPDDSKNYQKASEYFEKYILLTPVDKEILYLLGNSYFNSGNYEKAIKYYDDVLRLDKNHINSKNEREISLNKLNESGIYPLSQLKDLFWIIAVGISSFVIIVIFITVDRKLRKEERTTKAVGV